MIIFWLIICLYTNRPYYSTIANLICLILFWGQVEFELFTELDYTVKLDPFITQANVVGCGLEKQKLRHFRSRSEGQVMNNEE